MLLLRNDKSYKTFWLVLQAIYFSLQIDYITFVVAIAITFLFDSVVKKTNNSFFLIEIMDIAELIQIVTFLSDF